MPGSRPEDAVLDQIIGMFSQRNCNKLHMIMRKTREGYHSLHLALATELLVILVTSNRRQCNPAERYDWRHLCMFPCRGAK